MRQLLRSLILLLLLGLASPARAEIVHWCSPDSWLWASAGGSVAAGASQTPPVKRYAAQFHAGGYGAWIDFRSINLTNAADAVGFYRIVTSPWGAGYVVSSSATVYPSVAAIPASSTLTIGVVAETELPVTIPTEYDAAWTHSRAYIFPVLNMQPFWIPPGSYFQFWSLSADGVGVSFSIMEPRVVGAGAGSCDPPFELPCDLE